MYEVLSRRFRRSKTAETNAERAGWAVPDLLVIDGGKGQLNTALAALRDAQIDVGPMGIDVVGLAKEREDAEGSKQPDRVFLARAKDPIKLRSNTAELFLLSHIRDEAHRFAVTFHRKLRRGRTLRSTLDDVQGIGDRRKRELLKHFGSLKAVRAATVEELARAPGMTQKAAEAVALHLSGISTPGTGAPPEAPERIDEAVGETALEDAGAAPEDVGERDDLLFDDAGAQLETLTAAEGEPAEDVSLEAEVADALRE